MRTTALVWHVYIATARKEFRVADALRVLGGEAFVPHVVVRKARKDFELVPLVSKLVFAGFEAPPYADIADLVLTPRVGRVRILGMQENGEYWKLNRRDLAKARAMAEPPLAKVAPLKPGDRVKIKSGPFAECAAVLEEMLEGKAVLDIARAGRVTIKRDELEAA